MVKKTHPVVIFLVGLALLWSILSSDARVALNNGLDVPVLTIIEHGTTPERSTALQIELEHVFGRGSADVVAWSPDGQHLAIAGSLGIWLYDRPDWSAEPDLLADERGWVRELVFNADGSLLLAVDPDQNISLWDVETGEVIDQFGLTGDKFGIKAVGFTITGRVVVATSNGRYVALRDFHSGYPIWIRRANVGNARRLRFSENGHYLISEGEAPDTVIWDVESATPNAQFEAQRGVLMTRDGRLLDPLEAGGRGLRPVFYTADSGIVRQIFPLVGSDGFTVMDDNMQHVVYHDERGQTLVLVDIRLSQEVMRLSTENINLATAQLSRDGHWLAVANNNGEISITETSRASQSTLIGHQGPILRLSISPDSQELVSVSTDGSVRIWSLASMTTVAEFPHTMALGEVALSPDTDHIYAAGGTGELGLEPSVFNQIWRWERTSGQLEQVVQHHRDRVVNLTFQPEADRLAVGTLDGTVEIALADGLIPVSVRDSFGIVADLAFHPSGEQLAVAGIGIEIWSFNSTQDDDTQVLVTASPASAVAYSFDGKLIAGAHGDLVTVWEEGESDQFVQLYVLNRHHGEVVTLAFEPADSLLASGSLDGTVRLWDMDSGAETLQLVGDFPPDLPAAIFDVIFSPDGRLVIAGAGGHRQSESAIWIWATDTGELVASLDGHQAGVYGVAMSADGSYLVTASWDGTVRLWSIEGE